MVKTLILVRHGKPQPAAPDIPDFDRTLTVEGIAALAAPHGFARTFSLLSDDQREGAVIWSSLRCAPCKPPSTSQTPLAASPSWKRAACGTRRAARS